MGKHTKLRLIGDTDAESEKMMLVGLGLGGEFRGVEEIGTALVYSFTSFNATSYSILVVSCFISSG